MSNVSPRDVIAFWFAPPATTEDELMGKVRRWFMGGPAMDAEVKERFRAAVETAVNGGLEDWMASPEGRLALVLLLDQFTRNVYRDQPRMYAGDARAQRIALASFDDGSADQLGYVERLFLSMPLLHAEDSALQDKLAELVERFDTEAPPLYRKMAAMHHEQSAKYRGVIARFGRFPHRNPILGRDTTPDEAEFLRDWAEKGPPRGAPRPG